MYTLYGATLLVLSLVEDFVYAQDYTAVPR